MVAMIIGGSILIWWGYFKKKEDFGPQTNMKDVNSATNRHESPELTFPIEDMY